VDRTWKTRLLVLVAVVGAIVFSAFAVLGIDEDFEEWPLNYDWYTTSTDPWVLTTDQAHSGTHSVRSDHWDDSEIWVNMYIHEGVLTFWIYVDGYNAIACKYGFTEGNITVAKARMFYPSGSGWWYCRVEIDPGFANKYGFFKWHTFHNNSSGFGPWFYLDDVTFPNGSSDPALSKNTDNLDSVLLAPARHLRFGTPVVAL